MKRNGFFFCCLTLVLAALGPGRAEAQRVEVRRAGDRELRHTAYRLCVSTAMLRQARATLEEATDLALDLDPVPLGQLSPLARIWWQADRPQAPRKIELLYHHLRNLALEARDARRYRSLSRSAAALLQSFPGFSPTHLRDLVEEWPPPPEGVVQAHSPFQSLLAQQKARDLSRQVYAEPERALERILREPEAVGFGTYAQLAQNLWMRGREEQARQVVEKAVARFRESPVNPSTVYNFFNLVNQLSWQFPELASSAAELLGERSARLAVNEGVGQKIEVGGKSATLTSIEQQLLSLMRRSGSEQVRARILAADPDLKSKLDSLGGVQEVIRAQRRQGLRQNRKMFLWGQLASELAGAGEEATVRRKLETAWHDPKDLSSLQILLSQLCFSRPQYVETLVHVALGKIDELESDSDKLQPFQALVSGMLACNGEVDEEVLDPAFAVVDRLRQARLEENPEAAGRGGPWDWFEGQLVAVWARSDYAGALGYVRQNFEGERRLQLLLAVADMLTRRLH